MVRMPVIFTLMFFFMAIFGSYAIPGQSGIYKTHEIKIKPDPEFGEKTKWDELLYKGINGITFAPDGRFFVSARGQNQLFLFDHNGNLIKSIGQEGQGPGDFNGPCELGILDKKYLVVGEYPLINRISILDLNGKFIRLVRTRYPVFEVTPVSQDKLAIRTQSSIGRKSDEEFNQIRVIIKDIFTGKEKKVYSEDSSFIFLKANNIYFGVSDLQKKVFIKRDGKGNLIIGANYRDTIEIYSPVGEKILSFRLQLKPIEVTGDVIKEHRRVFLQMSRKRKWYTEKELDALKKVSDYSRFFLEILPLYKGILVDSEGNILVFHYDYGGDAKVQRFQVYSPVGKYLGESAINFGDYAPASPCDESLFSKITFFENRLYGFFEIPSTDEDNEDTKLLKITLTQEGQ